VFSAVGAVYDRAYSRWRETPDGVWTRDHLLNQPAREFGELLRRDRFDDGHALANGVEGV
jgi:hypothetical protein